MSENLKKFLELVSADKELQAKALVCIELGEEKGRPALLQLAKDCGITLTAADFEKKAKPASDALDDDELSSVAGGGGCACIAGGGGGGTDENDGKTYGCACVLYGQGGDGRAKDYNCTCIFTGDGYDENTSFFKLPAE